MKTRNVLILAVCLIIGLNIKAQESFFLLTDLSQIQNGSSIIFAARHDSLNVTSYYAMSNAAAGKPQGVAFTAATTEGGVVLPAEITDKESDFSWTVGITDGNYTFINPDGDMIGYGSSGTDFIKNGVNSTWSISAGTSGEETSVPNHNAYVVTNVGAPNRSFAFRKFNNGAVYEKFAPYSNSESNMGGDTYYFYMDIFVKASEAVPVVSLPIFSPAGGDYTSEQNVSISCETDGATIYYTLDGSNPTDESDVYQSPIKVSESTTIKAIAKKDGMTSSGIATATYNIIETVMVSLYNNGSLMETLTVEKGKEIGELPVATTPDGFSFSGWLETEIDGSTNTAPEIVTTAFVVNDNMNLYAAFSVSNNNCVESEVSDLEQTDAVVIAISKDDRYYAMSQIKGGNGQPTAYELFVSNGNITNAVPDDIKWNIGYNNGDMIVYPNEDEENWLYCTSGSNNNAVRIGDNEDNNVFELKTIEIDDVVYSDYLYNKSTERFVGAYYDGEVAIDWRAYKLTASGAFPTNIKNQTYHFFKAEGISFYCTEVEIPQAQTITTDAIMENVSVVNKIIIENGATLTINGALACVDSDNLVIKDGGQLIHNNAGVRATLEKEIEGYGSTNGGWYTISSPLVANIDMNSIANLITGDYDLYRYDEKTSMWQNVKDGSNDFTFLESGRGYLYANEDDVTLSFSGELAYETVNYHLDKTDGIALSGFHLIGNPYAHNIYKGKGASIDDDNLVSGYYTLSNSGLWGAKVSNENPIAPCQSILIKTTKECDIKIKKTNTPPSEKRAEKGIIKISVENNDYEDVAFVLFDDGEGLEKINHQNQDAQMIYIPLNNIDYAVATIDNDVKEIPISFKAQTMGEYTIKVSSEGGEFEYMYIVDEQTGDVMNMLANDYTFIATTNDNPERFVLKLYDAISVDEMEKSECSVYINNGSLMISNIHGNARIDVYDMLGRSVLSETYDNTNDVDSPGSEVDMSLSGFVGGVYIVRIVDSKGVSARKIIVK